MRLLEAPSFVLVRQRDRRAEHCAAAVPVSAAAFAAVAAAYRPLPPLPLQLPDRS